MVLFSSSGNKQIYNNNICDMRKIWPFHACVVTLRVIPRGWPEYQLAQDTVDRKYESMMCLWMCLCMGRAEYPSSNFTPAIVNVAISNWHREKETVAHARPKWNLKQLILDIFMNTMPIFQLLPAGCLNVVPNETSNTIRGHEIQVTFDEWRWMVAEDRMGECTYTCPTS